MARNDFSGTGTFNTDNVSYVGDDPTGIGYEEANISFTPGVGYGSQNIDTGGQSTDGSSLSESGYQNAMGITPTNPFGYDNFFSRNFGVDPRNINYTQQYADAPGGAASYMKGLGNDKYTNTFANPRNLSSLPGYDSNQKEGVLREAITGAPFGSLFGNNAGVKTAFGEVAEQDREMPFGEAASRLGIGALNPLLGYGLSNLGTTEMKLKTDADYDFTKDPNDPRYISKGAFSGILDSVTGGGGSKVAATARDSLLSLADGAMSYLSNKGKAGDTVENIVENIVAEQNKLQGPPLPPSQFDQFGNMVRSSIYDYSGNPTEPLSVIQNSRNKIEDLQQNASEVAQLREQGTDPNFISNTFPTIDRTNVLNNSFMDSGASLATDAEGIASLRPSIAQLSEDRKKQNALNTIFDMLNKDTQNIEIAAGANTGKTLNTALPERRDLNAFTSPGYLQTSNKYTLDEMLNRDLSRPQQGPPERTKKAPPGFVDITIEDSDRPSVFAGTNMPITGGKTIGSKLYSPANELELEAKTDAGFDLYPTPFNFFENTRFVEAESKPGVRLSPASYIFDPGKEEKGTTVRVPISSLPKMAQEVNSLRTDLDYGTSFPLQTILDGRKAINQGQFSQKEMSDFLAGFN